MHKRMTHMLNSEDGSILVVSLLIIFAVSIIGSTLAMVSSMDLKISGNQRKTTEALPVAEAGLSEAIHRLALPNPTNATIGGWTGNIAIGDTPPYDTNWETRVYMTAPNAAPAGTGSVVTTGTVQNLSGDHMTYSATSGTDDVLTIKHKWRDVNADGIRDPGEVVRYDPELVPPENMTSGFPVEIVEITGVSGTAKRSIEAEVTKRSVLARTLGALYVDRDITIGGTPAFCGHDHDITTPVWSDPMGCFAWHLGSGHLPGVVTTGDEIDLNGGAMDMEGDPTPTDTSSTNPFYTLAEVLGISDAELQQMLNNADNTAITDPLNGITYINGNATINSNLTGEGLIYVTGDLNGNGSFNYKGLIYVEGDLQFTGTPWLLGSMIVKGTTDFGFSAGNAEVLYSSDAISQYIGQYLPMIILSWREIR